MDKVLIITHSQENECFETVKEEVEKMGGELIRFNTDLYPEKVTLTSRFDGDEWVYFMKDENGVTFNISECRSIYYRRLYVAHSLKGVIEEKYLAAAQEEAKRTIVGFMESFDGFILNGYMENRSGEIKQKQLKLAHELGMKVPRTMFTNNPAQAKDFVNSIDGDVILKMQSSFAIYEEGVQNVVFTNTVDKNDDFENIEVCPMQFQEKVDKQLELRVTIVGRKVYSASIDSMAFENADVDWRRKGMEMISSWEHYDLPSAEEAKLLKFMDGLGMNYGAADIILDENGDHWFLEVNPGGEFFWLDVNPGLPISKEIASLLMGRSEAR